MHSVFNRTNNDNGIAAALLNGQLYRLGILIAVVVLIAALALVAASRRLNKGLPPGTRHQSWRCGAPAHQPLKQQSASVMTS
jgi:hypothetical protein